MLGCQMAVYSGTPLVQKLGIKPGFRIFVGHAPAAYEDIVGKLPAGVTIVSRLKAPLDMVHLFALEAAGLEKRLSACRAAIAPDGMVWVSWPKKASGVATDLSDVVVRPYLLHLIRGRHFWDLGRSFGGYLLKHGRIPPLRGGFRGALKNWFRPQDPMARYPKWLSPDFEKKVDLRERWHEMQRPFQSAHPWHPKAHSVLNGLFLSSILESEEPTWSGVPVVPRAPLLDLRLQRFLMRVPPVPLCVDKELLRRALRGLLPKKSSCVPRPYFKVTKSQCK